MQRTLHRQEERIHGVCSKSSKVHDAYCPEERFELQGQFINQARMQLANVTGSLFSVSSNLEPESPEAQQIQARVAAIQAIDKSLELQLRRVDTQRDAVQTEIDAVRKVIGKNIESTFKTFG